MSIPIPPRLAKRPIFHGLPIPFTTMIGDDGVPDFKVVDEHNRLRCLREKLCGLCGEPLPANKFLFVGGPKCTENHMFIDPAMHEECVMYAVKVCPFLADPNHGYADRESRLAEQNVKIKIFEGVGSERPSQMCIFYARDYEMISNQGDWYAKARQITKKDWKTIPRK